ncbi:hypothetical protein [Athalassotoga saccharophila]|uniref:hypothetical protein n=1 Tax=Athalassotoga saccharophila TaxID=1441386 RepID=UPI0013794BA9|nr:hypothetical protein [Athalassotoga saccharophila]BBJ28294.1 hypothetical protein ATHSA_1201 [Athalassotoga saccharophila]
MPRVNFYTKKRRKIKFSKFIVLMVMIIGIGIASYLFIDLFINGLYTQAISGQKNLLENAGIYLSMRQDQIQNRLDAVINDYSKNLDLQSKILYQIKDYINGVNEFHSAVSLIREMADSATFTIVSFSYSANSSTPLVFSQIIDVNNSNVADVERKIAESEGYKFSVSDSQFQTWFKTYEQTISIGGLK